MDAINELLTTAQVCERLHICRQTLHKHTNSGKIPKYRLGRICYYKESEVLQALTKIEPMRLLL